MTRLIGPLVFLLGSEILVDKKTKHFLSGTHGNSIKSTDAQVSTAVK